MRKLRQRLRRAFVLTVVGLAGCGDDAGPALALDASGGADALDTGEGDALEVALPDTSRARPDAPTGNADALRPNEGTTGKPCADDAECDPTGTDENACTAHHFSALGSLYPTPMCVGRECDPGPLGTAPRSCDGDHGICVGDGALVGTCLPRCSFDATSPARGCPEGTLCSPLWIERDVAGVAQGEGWCAPACETDSECSGTDHCLVDEGLCIGIPITRAYAIGARCDAYANPPEIECNCVHDNATGVGVCSTVCAIGDPKKVCPTGFLCTTALPQAMFSSEPSGVVAHCLPTCSADAECGAFVGHCAEGPSGKTCVPGPPPTSPP